jgi:hypothetical protein
VVELQISELLCEAFRFRCVRIDDMDERIEVAQWPIATLATCPDGDRRPDGSAVMPSRSQFAAVGSAGQAVTAHD